MSDENKQDEDFGAYGHAEVETIDSQESIYAAMTSMGKTQEV